MRLLKSVFLILNTSPCFQILFETFLGLGNGKWFLFKKQSFKINGMPSISHGKDKRDNQKEKLSFKIVEKLRLEVLEAGGFF